MTALITIYVATILIWVTALYIATRTIKRQDKEMRELNADINRHFAVTLHPRATYMATTIAPTSPLKMRNNKEYT